MGKKREAPQWLGLTQVSMTRWFLEQHLDKPVKDLLPENLRSHRRLVAFLEKQRLDTKLDFKVEYMPGSDWVYFVQRWRA